MLTTSCQHPHPHPPSERPARAAAPNHAHCTPPVGSHSHRPPAAPTRAVRLHPSRLQPHPTSLHTCALLAQPYLHQLASEPPARAATPNCVRCTPPICGRVLLPPSPSCGSYSRGAPPSSSAAAPPTVSMVGESAQFDQRRHHPL